MENTTALLKASIEYEQRKSDVLNLLNHKRQDLSLMIEIIDDHRKSTEHYIDSTQYYLDNAEDLAEGHEADQWKKLGELKDRLETLLAFRMLYLSAWAQVKR